MHDSIKSDIFTAITADKDSISLVSWNVSTLASNKSDIFTAITADKDSISLISWNVSTLASNCVIG
jgi:hypothetical protein